MKLPKINPDIIDSTVISFIEFYINATDEDIANKIEESDRDNKYFFKGLNDFGTLIANKEKDKTLYDWVVIGGLFAYNLLQRQIETDKLNKSVTV
jgi:hypothetical protein